MFIYYVERISIEKKSNIQIDRCRQLQNCLSLQVLMNKLARIPPVRAGMALFFFTCLYSTSTFDRSLFTLNSAKVALHRKVLLVCQDLKWELTPLEAWAM